MHLTLQPRRIAVGREDRRRPLRVRPARSEDRRLTTRLNYTITPSLSIQLYAEPFVSAGDYSNFKELVDGRRSRTKGGYAPTRLRRQSRLQLPLVPDDQRAALGVQARLDAVRRLAAGARRQLGFGDFNFNRDFRRRVRRTRQERVPRQVRVLDQSVKRDSATPTITARADGLVDESKGIPIRSCYCAEPDR